jgi:hypothetical protein
MRSLQGCVDSSLDLIEIVPTISNAFESTCRPEPGLVEALSRNLDRVAYGRRAREADCAGLRATGAQHFPVYRCHSSAPVAEKQITRLLSRRASVGGGDASSKIAIRSGRARPVDHAPQHEEEHCNQHHQRNQSQRCEQGVIPECLQAISHQPRESRIHDGVRSPPTLCARWAIVGYGLACNSVAKQWPWQSDHR